MSSEQVRTETNVCQPNTTISSTVTTKRNQQVYTQQIFTSRIRKVNQSSTEIENTNENNSLVPMNDFNTSVVDGNVKRTTKTYCRRIIRKIGPNGEVSEEIIEEGDAIPSNFFPPAQSALENSNVAAITDVSHEDLAKTIVPAGAAKFQASAAFNTVSETGEQHSLQMSTGPMEFKFNNPSNKMLSIEGSNFQDDMDGCNQLSTLNNSANSVQHVMPDGSIVTRTFYGEKSATVTHSSTINGQTQTSSKSAFMSFSGESMLEAKSSINDMEMIFGQMMRDMNSNTFNIFNQFITSNQNNMIDHLSLAGGDSDISLLALEPAPPEHEESSTINSWKNKFTKAIMPTETIHEQIPTQPVQRRETKDQQHEALIQQLILAIKDSKMSNRLYWSHMDEVKSSGILSEMTKEEIHLQEAIFEVITSEASYNISLDTLIEFYYNSDLLCPNKADNQSIINSVEKHHLFSNILLIKTVSLKLLNDLENRWSQQKPKISDFADIILKHAEDRDFQQQYINYLTNQSYQINCLRSLLQRETFKQALISIQSNPKCCKLSLDSFLALPMQRLTRLKLLVEVILKLMNQSEELYKKIPPVTVQNSKTALEKLKVLLTTSENNKFKMEQKARLIALTKILEFSGPCKNIAIGSKELIKEGEVKTSASQFSPNALKKLSRKRQPTFYLIVLSDLVIIAKKKSSTKLLVLEYCEKNKVEAYVTNNPIYSKPSRISTGSQISQGSVGSQVSQGSVGSQISQGSIGSQLSMSASDSMISQASLGYPFVLKFNKEIDAVLTEPLILTATTSESRDQWIQALTGN